MLSTTTVITAPAAPLVVAPRLGIADTAAAAVLAVIRRRGPITRDVIVKVTSLSAATVNRQVGTLIDAGLLQERPDLAASGAVGRPRVPVELNHRPFLTLGLHIGARSISIVATDIRGHTLDAVETPTPQNDPAAALPALADTARRYLQRWRTRQVLWVGVAVGGTVDSATGSVTHPRLGWRAAPVGTVIAERLGLRVSVASHVDAMAAAELVFGWPRSGAPAATTLYVYARETVGFALTIGGKVHTPARGPGSIAGLPVQRDLNGQPATLEDAVSDDAVLRAARAARIAPGATTVAAVTRAARAGDTGAAALLTERARILGESVALLADLLNPDSVVVGGQAFTCYPEGMAEVQDAFARRSTVSGGQVRATVFGDRVQEAGAGVVSLSALYADPVSAMRRARAMAAAGGRVRFDS